MNQSIANGADCTTAYRNLYQHRVAAYKEQLEYHPDNSELPTTIMVQWKPWRIRGSSVISLRQVSGYGQIPSPHPPPL